MTKEEILDQTIWDEYGMGRCLIFITLLEKEIPFIFFQNNKPNPGITDKMVECINEVLALNKSELNTIKEMLWEECKFALTVADYGFEPQGEESHLQAHLNGFGILSKEDAYAKSEVKEIHIKQEYDGLIGRYSEIKINAASENLVSIVVKNGKIIDFDDDGVTLGVFDNDEQTARKRRNKILNQ